MHQLNLFLLSWSWGLPLFAQHLFLLGLLIIRSGLFPKPIGYITCFAAACYFFHNTGSIFFSSYQSFKSTAETILALPMALGEVLLEVWLIRLSFKRKKHQLILLLPPLSLSEPRFLSTVGLGQNHILENELFLN